MIAFGRNPQIFVGSIFSSSRMGNKTARQTRSAVQADPSSTWGRFERGLQPERQCAEHVAMGIHLE